MTDRKEKYGKFKGNEILDGLVKVYTWETDDTEIRFTIHSSIQPKITVHYVNKEWLNGVGEEYDDL